MTIFVNLDFTIGNRLFSPTAVDKNAVKNFYACNWPYFFREIAQLDKAKSGKKPGLNPVPIFYNFQKSGGGHNVAPLYK